MTTLGSTVKYKNALEGFGILALLWLLLGGSPVRAGKLLTPYLNACKISLSSESAKTAPRSLEPQVIDVLNSLIDVIEAGPQPDAKTTENNSLYFRQMKDVVGDGSSINSKELSTLHRRVIETLSAPFHMESKSSSNFPHYHIVHETIAQPQDVTPFLVTLARLMEERSLTNLSRGLALKQLYVAGAYTLNNFMLPKDGQSLYLRQIFENYRPSSDTGFSEMLSVFLSLTRLRVKVPQSWHPISIQKRRQFLDQPETLNLTALYGHMSRAGIPLSLSIEKVIYAKLRSSRAQLSEGGLSFALGNMADALISPSLHKPRYKVILHFWALHRSVIRLQLRAPTDLRVPFMYRNAVTRLGIFYEGMIPPLIFPKAKPQTAHTPSSLEQKIFHRIRQLYPDIDIEREARPLKELPPVDFQLTHGNVLIEANGPSHDTTLIHESPEGVIVITKQPLRDLDIVTQEIHRRNGFLHGQFSYLDFNRSPDELTTFLRDLLGH